VERQRLCCAFVPPPWNNGVLWRGGTLRPAKLDRPSGAVRRALSAKITPWSRKRASTKDHVGEDGVGQVWQLKRRGDHCLPSCGSTAPIHHKTPNSGSAKGSCQEAEKGSCCSQANRRSAIQDIIEMRQTQRGLVYSAANRPWLTWAEVMKRPSARPWT
jgi:hypothetical protein